MVCYVFKGKSGYNLIHLPVHKPVGEGPVPREISLKTEEATTALGPLCFLLVIHSQGLHIDILTRSHSYGQA